MAWILTKGIAYRVLQPHKLLQLPSYLFPFLSSPLKGLKKLVKSPSPPCHLLVTFNHAL